LTAAPGTAADFRPERIFAALASHGVDYVAVEGSR